MILRIDRLATQLPPPTSPDPAGAALVANIAAEEFGHIELVATAINTMLTGTGEKGDHLPVQEGVFAPDYAPEEIAEIARRLRQAAGLSDEPTGVVANDTDGVISKVKDAVS